MFSYVSEFHDLLYPIITMFQISTNAMLLACYKYTNTTLITVTLMQTVPTPRDHSTVPVIRGIQEMESRV